MAGHSDHNIKLPEPWRTKMVEAIHLPDRSFREARLQQTHFNIFNIPSDEIFIDLLTDSGTSAMSDNQWAGLLLGDESYASARSFFHFEEAVRDISGFPHVIPTHQGRAAEHLLFKVLIHEGEIVPSNSHFDTTWTHIRFSGGNPVDLAIDDANDLRSDHPFKGNIDLGKLERLFQAQDRGKIPLMTLTLTNNLVGGQPVSLENIRGAHALCRRYGIKLFFDAARFAENAWFIQQREPGMRGRSVRDIARECFDLADGCTMSAKKDGLVNIGGFIACRDDDSRGARQGAVDRVRGLSHVRRPGRARSRGARARAA